MNPIECLMWLQCIGGGEETRERALMLSTGNGLSVTALTTGMLPIRQEPYNHKRSGVNVGLLSVG